MKKLLLLSCFFLMAGMASAQTCAKTCAKKCTKTATTADAAVDSAVASALAEADIAAEADENIEKRTCPDTGEVCYFSKDVCMTSGKVSYNKVEYSADSKSFVASASAVADIEEAPAAKEGTKKSCAKTCTSKKKTEEQ